MVAALLALPPLVAAVLLWRANRTMHAGIRAAAEADPVTGLPGRPRFQADLDARLAGRARATLLLARIDGFAASASVGRVTLPREATSAGEALRVADARADLARRAADPKPREASPTSAL